MKNKILVALFAIIAAVSLTACFDHESDIVSRNISNEADKFNIPRRVIFFNGITDKYLLTIEGYCALGNSDKAGELTVTCLTGPGEYKKHFLGLSDNVTYMVEQLDGAKVSKDHYKVTFKPETIIPDIEIR